MKLKPIFIGLAVLLCVGLIVFAIVKIRQPASGGGDSDDESSDENVQTIVSVQVGHLQRMTLHQNVTGYGMIEAAPATTDEAAGGGPLAAPTAGIVSAVKVVAGQRVKKGEVLVELNSSAATFDYAKTEVARQKELFAGHNTSLKNLEDAEAQLSSLEVVAPVAGTVTAMNVKPGQAVDSTTIVAEVIDMNRLAAAARIPASQAGELKAGEEIKLEKEKPVTATLTFVSQMVDPNDGTVSAWAMLPKESGLLPGEFVPVSIVTATHTNCLAAPAESVVTDDQGNSSIALVHGDEATNTPVQTGFREGGWVEVSAPGLRAGDTVVTVGAYGLPDQTQIKIVNGETSSTNSLTAQ